MSAVCRLPSAVCRLPSAVCRLPSAVCRLPSAVCANNVFLQFVLVHSIIMHFYGEGYKEYKVVWTLMGEFIEIFYDIQVKNAVFEGDF